jgi:hypothetical protein
MEKREFHGLSNISRPCANKPASLSGMVQRGNILRTLQSRNQIHVNIGRSKFMIITTYNNTSTSSFAASIQHTASSAAIVSAHNVNKAMPIMSPIQLG